MALHPAGGPAVGVQDLSRQQLQQLLHLSEEETGEYGSGHHRPQGTGVCAGRGSDGTSIAGRRPDLQRANVRTHTGPSPHQGPGSSGPTRPCQRRSARRDRHSATKPRRAHGRPPPCLTSLTAVLTTACPGRRAGTEQMPARRCGPQRGRACSQVPPQSARPAKVTRTCWHPGSKGLRPRQGAADTRDGQWPSGICAPGA